MLYPQLLENRMKRATVFLRDTQLCQQLEHQKATSHAVAMSVVGEIELNGGKMWYARDTEQYVYTATDRIATAISGCQRDETDTNKHMDSNR